MIAGAVPYRRTFVRLRDLRRGDHGEDARSPDGTNRFQRLTTTDQLRSHLCRLL